MSSQTDLVSQKYSPTRAKSFNVKTTGRDYAQYANTIKAYALAGMPFEHIANAGDHLGDLVERLELDAPIQESWKHLPAGRQGKIGEIAEDEGKIMAWQTRGEKVPMSHQLSQATTVTGMEMVTISQEITLSGSEEKTIDVVEGIAVVRKDSFLEGNMNSALENNVFLKTPTNLK